MFNFFKNEDVNGLVAIADTFINGTEFRVNTYTTGGQYEPSAAALSNGGFIITWSSDQEQAARGIYAQGYDSIGNSQGSEFHVNTYTTNTQDLSFVSGLAGSNFVVTWQSNMSPDPSSWDVFGQCYSNLGVSQGSEFKINTYTTSSQGGLTITELSNGNFLIAWHSDGQDGSGYGISGQLYDSACTVQGGEFTLNTITAAAQVSPSVIALTDGGFLAAWDSSSADWEIVSQRFSNNGNPQGSSFQTNTHTTGEQRFPSVAALINGGFMVTWVSDGQDGSGTGIYGQCFDSSGLPVNNEFRVNTYTIGNQGGLSSFGGPLVAALANNGFVVTWDSDGQDGNGLGVYYQRYDNNCNSVGNEILVNTYTAGDQQHPTISALNNGGFIVAWESTGQDGDIGGIYAKIFTPVTSPSPAPAPPPFPWFNNPFIIFTAIGFGTFALLVAAALAYAKYQSKKSNGQIKVDAEMEQVLNPTLRQNDDPLIVVSPHSIKTAKDEEGRAPSGSVVSTLPESYLIPYNQLTLGKILGQGAYGIVYEGTWENSKVAIKQLLETKLNDAVLKDFLKESEVMANLHHDNVIRFNGVSIDEPGHLSMVMELMPHGSLFDLLQNDQPLTWDVRYTIANDITAGLGYLHHRDILHRDLKSLNVLIGYGMRAKLTDFGMAKIKSQTRSTKTLAEGNTKGTIAWMAPEQFKRGFEASKSSDIYSYGMVLWELVTRKIPFDDASSVEVLTSWVKDAEQEKIPEDCPLQLAKLIKWCWEKEPSARPTTDQAALELKSYQASLEEGGPEAPAPEEPQYQANMNTNFAM